MNKDKAVKRSKRAYKRKTASKHGNDRNHLAKLLQRRTATIKRLKDELDTMERILNSIVDAIGQYDDVEVIRSLIWNMK